MAVAKPGTSGRNPRGRTQHDQTEAAAPTAERLVYTVPEAGRLLGLSRNGSYEAAKRGDIPTIRIGRLLFVPKAPFHMMIELPGNESASTALQRSGVGSAARKEEGAKK